MKNYRKKGTQPMFPWTPEVDMTRVSVSPADADAGHPMQGDMIAVSASNPDDQWLVAKDFFDLHYVEVD